MIKLKNYDAKNWTDYFYDDIIDVKSIDLKIHKKIFLFTVLDMWR